jgi:hypothetical protein
MEAANRGSHGVDMFGEGTANRVELEDAQDRDYVSCVSAAGFQTPTSGLRRVMGRHEHRFSREATWIPL